MNFDFLYHSYTFTITIFAAVFGMAYPLMLQAIERIDDKYTSSVLATDLRKRLQFRAFNVLIILCIICLPILAYIIEATDSAQNKYIAVSTATLLVIALMIDVVFLVRQILIFYSPKELLGHLDDKNDKKNANALLDLARFAEKADEFILYTSSLSSVLKYILDEQKNANYEGPIVYSKEVNDILAKIAKKVGDTSQNDDRYNYVGLVPVIYNNEIQGRISAVTFLRMWEMVNRAAKSGNSGWFRDYWTYADQYYRFAIHDRSSEATIANMMEFYHYHVMVGALLVYFKRYDWLRHILHFTQEMPARFALIPGTLIKIISELRYLEQLLSKPFGVYQKYQFYGLDKGVRMDEAIVGYAYQYLALLIVRIWTYKGFNYNYANPFDLPLGIDDSIEANEDMIISVEQLQKCVERWYDNGTINEFGLSNIPPVKEVTGKLNEYIVSLKLKNKEIELCDEVDEHKVKVIKDEIIVSNAYSHCSIPMISDEWKPDNNYISYSTPVVVSQTLEKPFITKGSNKSMGNFGNSLVVSLNFELTNEYINININSIQMQTTTKYSINQRHLLDAIDKLDLPEDYIIIEWGNALNMYELKKKLTYNDNEVSYNGRKILNLGMCGYPACLWFVKEDDLPLMEIVDTLTMSADFSEIDHTNYLYSNIDHLKSPYDIKLVQSIKVYTHKKFNKTCLFKVVFDYGNNSYDMDKVVKL